ncbi:hypothetical protein GGTG_10061 [Gaeumannomyces tritici R3-111a-1]|uniref:Uncharacterized protein n=1 Tax=Gaeumannomyces tritici (strain R3-111a-1) TaxID=644352 RepID=J3P977_GAET3|nr:hypothetical protein GGTG_10061 [Gaeumannomyces tritici R3-111a-1]EJT73213.1 hypothetical protein GGTG_10061 [Gaeumannomyces tritici R3-111a-1]
MAALTHEEQMAEARSFMQSTAPVQARNRPRGGRGGAGRRGQGDSHPGAQGNGRTNAQRGGGGAAQGGGSRGGRGGGRASTQGPPRGSGPRGSGPRSGGPRGGGPRSGGPRGGPPARHPSAEPSVSHDAAKSGSTGQETAAAAGPPPAPQQQTAAIAAKPAETLKAREAARAAPAPTGVQVGALALAEAEGDVDLPAPVVEYYQPGGTFVAVDGSSDLIDLHEGACACERRRQAKGLAGSRFAVASVAPSHNEGRFTGICPVHDIYEGI